MEEKALSNSEKYWFTIMAFGTLGAILGLWLMYKYTPHRGFWWGIGYAILGSAAGRAAGTILTPNK